ncbi:helix-turn-helix domain-containing protein, partial [uncultured Desulfovibrio sp.]
MVPLPASPRKSGDAAAQCLTRLMRALDVASDAELARALGITPQSVNGARRRGEVPPAWVQTCAAQTGVNA